MPSIFIWKADNPNISKKSIKCYSGSNWILEDNDHTSKSYMYIEQIVISESDNSVITFHTKVMPQDWIGSELLEVSSIPYEIVKSDNYGILEHIGNWMRFTTKNETEFNKDFLKSEFIKIKKWIYTNTQTKSEIYIKSEKQNTNVNIFDSNKIQLDFQDFFDKYNLKQNINHSNKTNTNTLKSKKY